MKCQWCEWENKHNPLCPQTQDPKWEEGFKEGNSGKLSSSSDPVFMLGWNAGAKAMEERENGYDPRFHQ